MKGPAEIAHGPMFIGFIFNVLLYGIMITQVYLYFTTFKKDQTWMKIFVFVLLIADTVNTVFDSIYLYRSLIVHFGNDSYLATANWRVYLSLSSYLPKTTHAIHSSSLRNRSRNNSTTVDQDFFPSIPNASYQGLIASLVQFFFAWRVLVLTRSAPLAAAVVLGSLAGGAGAVAAAIEVGRTPQFVEFRRFKSVVIIWLASESITDVFITTILVWHLHLQILQRILVTVQTGFITSLVATLDLIFFLTDPTGTHLIFNFPLCKLYTNSLMSSLNSRAGWKFGSSKKDFSSVDTGTTLGVFSTSNFAQAPRLSHNSPPNSQFALQHAHHSVDNLGTPGSPRRSRGLSVPRPSAAVANLTKNSRPEVFVHVESHQSRDNVSPQKPEPGGINADMSDGTSEGQEHKYGAQELENDGKVGRAVDVLDMEEGSRTKF
ncbi:hypothetical protein NLJ89_g1288 [Agrocybe chaxingu]|uniref:DUF6534 domain-containing protein n=1 Tax=Agrocybe chaxingu TaxID=84603 RepID=A0A9W8TDP0_9AGAR|nr:hypothetical protein NLJ89_g1288 [Agrocybe chaxingu]